MKIVPGRLSGLVVIEPGVHGDSRGFFMEIFNEERLAEAGLPLRFTQGNLSSSRRGTLRGMHWQKPRAQGKLVMVIQGEVFDAAVDIRRGSPTFGQWESCLLSSENKKIFLVPPGFAHGFQVTSESALFMYACTDCYHPECENAFSWNDPAVGIRWPIPEAVLSKKDEAAKPLSEVPAERLF